MPFVRGVSRVLAIDTIRMAGVSNKPDIYIAFTAISGSILSHDEIEITINELQI